MGRSALKKRKVDISVLSDKMRTFAFEYPIDHNATQAAIRAGYSEKTAQVKGSQLLTDPRVQYIIAQREQEYLAQNGLELNAVLLKVSQSIHRDFTDLCDENGNAISDMRKIPKRAYAYIDGFKARQYYDEDGNITSQTLEFKLSPSAVVQDMGMRHNGAYAPEKTVNLHGTIDPKLFDELANVPADDVIEAKIKALDSQGAE